MIEPLYRNITRAQVTRQEGKMDIKAVIMAGGKGTRINGIASDIPKPMIDICGKPLLERQLEWLISQGIDRVTIIVGYLSSVVIDYFGDGEKFGISVDYIIEEHPLGTAGGLYYIADNKQPILLINGDIMLDVNLEGMVAYHKLKKADITLLTHPNYHPYDSALIITDIDGRVTKWINKEDKRIDYKNRVNAGVHIIEQSSLDFIKRQKDPQKIDLDRDILKPGIEKHKIYAYDSPEYVKDMGTPDRYYQVCRDLDNGIVSHKNLLNRQKAIFLDRDGTINTLAGFVKTPDELSLIDGVAQAIGMINRSEYLTIVITNQPVIARGDCTLEGLEEIHNRMERLLGEEGAFVDDIFFCPHHPDRGFEMERLEYKIKCECRKPRPGMILQAANKYNIDLRQSFFIGDSMSDILAGKAAGCKTGYIGRCEFIGGVLPDMIGENLFELIERVLK